jgi:selenocysteine lyase/cysteine desulfurase
MIYLDNAATTFPKPECVYTAMDQFARICGVSIGRGQHSLSSKAAYIADETRELLQELFHASNKKVVFTKSTKNIWICMIILIWIIFLYYII